MLQEHPPAGIFHVHDAMLADVRREEKVFRLYILNPDAQADEVLSVLKALG